MKAVVIVESMFGSTLSIAEAIREGMQAHSSVSVISVTRAVPTPFTHADVAVVGGPTHRRRMSTDASRTGAAVLALDPSAGLDLEHDATGGGIREWLGLVRREDFPQLHAAFDTRVRGFRLITGAASLQIDRKLRDLGSEPVLPPMSFLVGPDHKLLEGEWERAREWGDHLARATQERLHGAD
jgi:hypothetical protein